MTGFDPAAVPDANGDNPTDQGADIELVCRYYMETTGILVAATGRRYKITAHAPVDPRNVAHVCWSTQIYGTTKLGINVPDCAISQFDAGQAWDVVPGMKFVDAEGNPIGGHDVPILYYDSYSKGVMLRVGTWGKVQLMTEAFLLACCDEVRAVDSPDWLYASGAAAGISPSGFDAATMRADLQAVR
jgi:hypothetical protein